MPTSAKAHVRPWVVAASAVHHSCPDLHWLEGADMTLNPEPPVGSIAGLMCQPLVSRPAGRMYRMGEFHMLSARAQRLAGHTGSDRDAKILSTTVSADRLQRSLTSCAWCSIFRICTIPASAAQSLQFKAWFRLSAGWVLQAIKLAPATQHLPATLREDPPAVPRGKRQTSPNPWGQNLWNQPQGPEIPVGFPLAASQGGQPSPRGSPVASWGIPHAPGGSSGVPPGSLPGPGRGKCGVPEAAAGSSQPPGASSGAEPPILHGADDARGVSMWPAHASYSSLLRDQQCSAWLLRLWPSEAVCTGQLLAMPLVCCCLGRYPLPASMQMPCDQLLAEGSEFPQALHRLQRLW